MSLYSITGIPAPQQRSGRFDPAALITVALIAAPWLLIVSAFLLP